MPAESRGHARESTATSSSPEAGAIRAPYSGPRPDRLDRLPAADAAPRTLIFHPALAPYRVDLFRALHRRLPLELIFLDRAVSEHAYLDQGGLRAAMGFPVDFLPSMTIFARAAPVGLAGEIRRRRPDVVVTSEFSLPSIAACLARRRHRFGHVIWSDESLAMLAQHNAARRALRRLVARRAQALVMCSAAVAEAFARRYRIPRGSIHLCGVHRDPNELRRQLAASEIRAAELVREHALTGRRVLLYVGRLARVKNLRVATQVFAEVFAAEPDTLLVLVGSGEEQAAIREVAESAGVGGRILLTGPRQGLDLIAWYRIASALLLPSTWEPYGAVINEALICGVPVLCSQAAGASHLVREGESGFTFSPHAPSELADRLRRLAPRLVPAELLAGQERPSLMSGSFEDDLDGFVAAVREAARRA